MATTIDEFKGEYRFLSNFASAKVEYCGFEYPTAEHAYQAAKSLSIAVRREILAAESPGVAKKMGQKVEIRQHWDKIRWCIMFDIVWTKFNRNPRLAARLKATGDANLVEANTWGDVFWGVCEGVGENFLGLILEQVRGNLP